MFLHTVSAPKVVVLYVHGMFLLSQAAAQRYPHSFFCAALVSLVHSCSVFEQTSNWTPAWWLSSVSAKVLRAIPCVNVFQLPGALAAKINQLSGWASHRVSFAWLTCEAQEIMWAFTCPASHMQGKPVKMSVLTWPTHPSILWPWHTIDFINLGLTYFLLFGYAGFEFIHFWRGPLQIYVNIRHIACLSGSSLSHAVYNWNIYIIVPYLSFCLSL